MLDNLKKFVLSSTKTIKAEDIDEGETQII